MTQTIYEGNIAQMILNRIDSFGSKFAFTGIEPGKFDSPKYTWQEFGRQKDQITSFLIKTGIGHGDRVGIFSQNMPQWTIADAGILSAGAVSVPFYATHTTSYARYMVLDAEISTIFIGEKEQYDAILPVLFEENSLETLILFDEKVEKIKGTNTFYFSEIINQEFPPHYRQEIKSRIGKIRPDDLATIIYTSGTTGDPKGVMLTHDNFIQAFRLHDQRLQVYSNDVSLSFLPLSHVFERTWTYYIIHKGAENYYLRNPKLVIEAMQQVKPTLMCTVPRLLEKVYQGIQDKMDKAPAFQKNLFKWVRITGRKNLAHVVNQTEPGAFLRLRYWMSKRLIFNRLLRIFGGRIRFMPCAGSPLARELNEFFQSIGLHVKYGYGLTETTATVCAFTDHGFNLDSIGKIFPELEVKIGAENEIMVKGKTVMKGYYNKPEETAKVFEGEWFRTGDAGSIDEVGNMYFQERIKELIKTSVGKYISPQMLENIISSEKFVDQIAIFGDNRKYVSALIVPSFEFLEEFARKNDIGFKTKEELIENSRITQFIKEKIDQIQQHLPSYEQVKKFKLLPSNFSLEKNELTPTLKLKRSVIEKKYKDLIDKMYDKFQ